MPKINDLRKLSKEELIDAGFRFWDENLVLIPAALWNLIPNNTLLISIEGDRGIKGIDNFDMDTRGGLLAYGFKYDLSIRT